jgi:hemerythrin-like domain-containing protein
MPAFNNFRSFEALDSCHQQIQSNLDALGLVVSKFCEGGWDDQTRQSAQEIETFFSNVARSHHAAEETEVFPCLLNSEDEEMVLKVRDLIEDHFWIEKYWHDLAPMLAAIGSGSSSTEAVVLAKAAKLFLDLCNCHIESEESMIYPQAKASMARLFARDVTG